MFFIAYTLDGVAGPHRPAGHVRVQRRAGLGVGLAAPRAASGRAARRSATRACSAAARSGSSTTSTRCSTRPTSCSSIRSRTGYSRAVAGEKAKQFHGFQRDIESVGELIRLWTHAQPALDLAEVPDRRELRHHPRRRRRGYLQERYGMFLNGVMLVSCALDFATLRFDRRQRRCRTSCFLPTYAATAWYHKRLRARAAGRPARPRSPRSRRSPSSEYAVALAQGARLPDAERRADRRSSWRATPGLDEDYIDRADLRIETSGSSRSCCATERHDRRPARQPLHAASTATRPARRRRTTRVRPPSTAPYTATFNDYVRGDLGFETDLPYEILAPTCGDWSYADHENQYVNVGETLRKAMTAQPVPAGVRRERLLRPRDAVLRDRVHVIDHLGLDPSAARQRHDRRTTRPAT